MKYAPDKLFGARRRIWEIDFLRGLSLILMLMDHIMVDFAELPSFYNGYAFPALSKLGPGSHGVEFLYWLGDFVFYRSAWREALHYIFASVFLLLTGVSCSLTRSNGARCVRLAVFSVILTLGTAVADALMDLGVLIIFGVIHCMTAGLLFYIVIDGGAKLLSAAASRLSGKKTEIKSDLALLLAGGAIIIVGILIKWYDESLWIEMPARMTVGTFLKIAFGFARTGGDHFGIFPSAGMILVGAYIGRVLYRRRKSLLPRLDGAWNHGVCFIGRNTVWVYLLHQPLIAGVIMLVGILKGYVVM